MTSDTSIKNKYVWNVNHTFVDPWRVKMVSHFKNQLKNSYLRKSYISSTCHKSRFVRKVSVKFHSAQNLWKICTNRGKKKVWDKSVFNECCNFVYCEIWIWIVDDTTTNWYPLLISYLLTNLQSVVCSTLFM